MSTDLLFVRRHRVLPEFDRLTDEQFRRYVRLVMDREPVPTKSVPTLACFAIFLTCLVGGLGFENELNGWRSLPGDLSWANVLVAIGILLGLVTMLALRDRAIRRALARLATLVRCHGCNYSLLGLPVSDGATTCPECGAHIILADHHLTPEDLLAKPATPASAHHQEDPA